MIKVKYLEQENGKRFKRETIAYTADEFDGEYVLLENFQKELWDIEKGDWIETQDGYVVEVLKSTRSYFRIPSLDGYSRIHRGIYFRTKRWPLFETKCGHWEPSDKLTDQQARFVWELATTWDIVLACRRSRYKYLKNAFDLLQLPKIQEALRMSLKSLIETLGKDEKDLFFSRWEKMMDSLQKGVDANLTENPEGSAKLADVMTKNLGKISEMIYGDDKVKLNSGGFVAFGQLPAAKRGYDLHRELEDAKTKEITNGQDG